MDIKKFVRSVSSIVRLIAFVCLGLALCSFWPYASTSDTLLANLVSWVLIYSGLILSWWGPWLLAIWVGESTEYLIPWLTKWWAEKPTKSDEEMNEDLSDIIMTLIGIWVVLMLVSWLFHLLIRALFK